MGKFRYERCYYHCESCQKGWFPTDEELGVRGRKTRAAEEVIALAGVVDPFEEAAHRVLAKLSGLNLSKSTVQRTTEAVGDDLARRRAAGETFGRPEVWSWQHDSRGKTAAYVSLDATGVPQQGPHKQKAEARMPWVAAVFNPQPKRDQKRGALRDARYVSGLMSLQEIGGQLRRECQAVGVSQADLVIGLTDGGNGLENCLLDAVAGLAKDIHFILDFYHAGEHLREFAKVLCPHNEEQRKAQANSWCETLKHSGGETLLAELEALDLTEASDSVLEAHRQLTGYLRSNLHRTDYPTYLANGWQIGSGVIESACKSVVASRLKGPGMRWRPYGTTALCQLRALHKSRGNVWDHYWHSTMAG